MPPLPCLQGRCECKAVEVSSSSPNHPQYLKHQTRLLNQRGQGKWFRWVLADRSGDRISPRWVASKHLCRGQLQLQMMSWDLKQEVLEGQKTVGEVVAEAVESAVKVVKKKIEQEVEKIVGKVGEEVEGEVEEAVEEVEEEVEEVAEEVEEVAEDVEGVVEEVVEEEVVEEGVLGDFLKY